MNTTFKAAFADAGFSLRNPRLDWSAVKDDGSAVAVTVWSDKIQKLSEPWLIDFFNDAEISLWKDHPGNKKRILHLKHAIDHCEGILSLILIRAVDPMAYPRKIQWARHWHQRYGFIEFIGLNEATGECRIELRASE